MIVSPIKAAEAAALLGINLEDLCAATLARAYKLKAKECHPDHHGDAHLDKWARVSWANDCLKHWLNQRKAAEPTARLDGVACINCNGTGRVRAAKAHGFVRPLTMACHICKGLGTLEPEEHDHD